MTWTVPAAQAAELTSTQQDRFDELVGQAVELYSAGRYEKAIELFEKAFAVNDEPELLYNIARCYERLAVPKEAVEAYERFLESPGTTGELRTKALENIASLRREIAALEASKQYDQPQTGQEPQTADVGDTTFSPGITENDQPTSLLKVMGWTLMGVGGAGIITGAIFGGLAAGDRQKYDDADFDEARVGYRDDLERNALIFDIAFFGGVGLAAVGTTLLIVNSIKNKSESSADLGLEQHSPKSSARMSLAPVLMADGNNLGFGMQGSF